MRNESTTRPFVRGVGSALAIITLLGCASGGEDAPGPETISEQDVTPGEETAPGPVVVTRRERSPSSEEEIAESDSGVREEVDEEESAESRTRVFRDPTDPPRRDDGRPLWWFDEARRDGDVIRLCAEAIGGSILQARREAIERGRERAERLYGIEGTIKYERIWIWPTRSTGQVRSRYAAFVMLRFVEEG